MMMSITNGFSLLAERIPAEVPDFVGAANLWMTPGILITIILLAMPVLLTIWLMKEQLRNPKSSSGAGAPTEHVGRMPLRDAGGGLLRNVDEAGRARVLPAKQPSLRHRFVHPPEARMILWYFITSAFWLIFGTTVGQYVGMKFVMPDMEQFSWLTFGRLRPVHTNSVFWGWASLSMVGLGYYVVATVGNVRLASVRAGWWTLGLMNAGVLLGSLSLMAGINNGGGEYR